MADAPADVVDGKLRLPPAVWRMALWGSGALCALAAMTFSAISESGAQRLQQAVNAVVGTPPPVVVTQIAPPPGPTPESLKLAEDLRQMSLERERLNGRLAKLETMLEDVTGSVKRQTERAEQMARVTPPPAPATPPPVVTAPAVVAAVPPPTPAPVAPAAEPPQPAAAVPLPPERIASVEPDTSKPSIGIDVGGASSSDALKAHWASVKANYGPMLGPLQPMIVSRERKGAPTSYRLVLGPLVSPNAAVQVCSRLIAARLTCRPITYTSETAAQL